jgi:phosphate transport system substrate-binding protein
VVRKDNPNPDKTRTMTDFLKWALTKGQDYAADLYYAPLPQSLRDKVITAIGTVK